MIKTDYIFDNIDGFSCVWVPDKSDVSGLAKAADVAIEKGIEFLSLPVGTVEKVWPWLEHSPVKLLTRVEFDVGDDVAPDVAMSKLARQITDAFRHGASGCQIFVHIQNIPEFIEKILPLRDDLFFERYFSVVINIGEIKNCEWKTYFDLLNKIKPDSVLITEDGDSFNPKSDFVGRIFAILESWEWKFALHVMFGKNMMRISQVLRLVQTMQPKLIPDFRVFTVLPQE